MYLLPKSHTNFPYCLMIYKHEGKEIEKKVIFAMVMHLTYSP